MLPKKNVVQKLDVPSLFDQIETGLKTTRSMRNNHNKKAKTFFNLMKSVNGVKNMPKSYQSISWMGKNHKKLHQAILDKHDPDKYEDEKKKISVGKSRITDLTALAYFLLAIDKDKFKEYVRPIYTYSYKYQKEVVEKQQKKNELTEDDLVNFVCFKDIVKERERLYQEWQKNYRNNKLNLYHLILAFNTYIPPLRINLPTMKLWRNKSEPPEDYDNYLWEHKPGKWKIVINYDKIENKRQKKDIKRDVFDLSKEIGSHRVQVTNGKKLQEIINESLAHFKRDTYVLRGIKRLDYSLPMGDKSYISALHTMFQPKQPGQNIIRKAFINHWHDTKHKLSDEVLEEIARRMRHTLSIARTAYKKINIDCDDDTEPIDGMTIRPQVAIPRPAKKEKKDYFDPKEYSKRYRENNKEDIQKKRKKSYQDNKDKVLAQKVLWNLNNGKIKHPRMGTVDKYKLRYDAVAKQWVSDL